MPFTVLLVDGDQTSARWLKTLLDHEKIGVDIVPSIAAAFNHFDQSLPGVLVTEIALADGNGLDMILRLRGDPTTRDLPIIILSSKDQPQDIADGLQAGANDYISKHPGAEADLIDKIRALIAIRHPDALAQPLPPSRAKIISFCSAKGGTGTTSVCINVAAALAQLEPQAEIVLVDMVLPFGTVGQYLGVDQARTLVNLTQESVIDPATVSQYVLPKNQWGFRPVLGSSEPHQAAEMDASKLRQIFFTLGEQSDYLLIDFGRTLSPISLPIIESSPCVVIIVSPDPGTVRSTRPLLNYLNARGVPRDRIFVVNNRTVGRMWTTSEEMEQTMGIKPHATVPYAVESMTLSINETIPFIARFPDHAASTAIMGIARTLQDKFRDKRTL